MFGLSWGELMVVGVVALIVVGPKDLPGLFRSVGEFTGKARRMAREFSRAMEQAAEDSGVNDINKTIRAATNPTKFGTDAIKDSVTSTFKEGSETAKLSEQRQADKKKIDEAMAKAATERMEREAAEKAAAEATPKPASKPKPKAATKAKPKAASKPKAAPKAKAKPKPKPKAET